MTLVPGAKPAIDWNNPSRVDTMWISTGEFGNSAWALNRGVEFDIDLGRVEQWNTSFFLSGAFMETQSKSTAPTIATPKNKDNVIYSETNTTPFKYVYPGGNNINTNRRISSQFRAVLNIPALRMVLSSSLQVIWYSYSASLNQRSSPIAYLLPNLATNGVTYHPITEAMLADKDYTILTGSDNPPISMPPLMMMSTRLTKDISKMAGFSFFVNNTLFYQPWQSSSASSTLTERNQGTFNFGMELYFKF